MLWISVNSYGLVTYINCSYKWELHFVSLNVCLRASVHHDLFNIKLLLFSIADLLCTPLLLQIHLPVERNQDHLAMPLCQPIRFKAPLTANQLTLLLLSTPQCLIPYLLPRRTPWRSLIPPLSHEILQLVEPHHWNRRTIQRLWNTVSLPAVLFSTKMQKRQLIT